MIAAPGLDAPLELRAQLADLYCAYGDVLDEGELERWPDLFTKDCLYKVIPRENLEQGLPIALIYRESRAMLVDRVVALRETALYVPRIVRHLTSNIRLRTIAADGLRLTASFALYQTDNARSAFRAVPVWQILRPGRRGRRQFAIFREGLCLRFDGRSDFARLPGIGK